MAPERGGNRVKALEMWIKSKGKLTPKEIADKLGVTSARVRQWKHLDNWDNIEMKRPRGAPKGNKNAVGNNGGAPLGNQNAVKHGYYAKYLPESILEIVKEIEDADPLEMLWNNIIMLQAKLLHGQRITHVKDKDDMTKELKRKKFMPGQFGDGKEKEYEIQFAHDKFANASKADVLMMRELRGAIKQFLDMAPENDERRAKLSLMQAQVEKTNAEVEKVNGGGKNSEAEDWVAALKEAAEKRKSRVKPDE
jgi:Uncharacterized conserved protein